MESGFFGSSRWDSKGEPLPDFSPVQRPKGNWRAYRDLLARIGDVQSVAMANFIPWGSENADAFVKGVASVNRRLLQRALEFADDLNVQIVCALRPRLLFVPFSLGLNRRLDIVRPLRVTLDQAIDVKHHTVLLTNGRFNFYTRICRRGKLEVRTVFLRHPASLRLANGERDRLVAEVAAVLTEF